MTYSQFHKMRYEYVFKTLDPSKQKEIPEKEVEAKMAEYFSQWFTVYRQVTSDCKNFRCDLLMYHKENGSLQTPVLIEIKKKGVKRGASMGEWCRQASSYAETTFHGKRPIVCIFPQITGIYLEEGCEVSPHDCTSEKSHNISSFLYGSFRIGEIRKFKYRDAPTYAIIINTHIIWHSVTPWTFTPNFPGHGH